jgi:hypothetical protein
MEAGFGHLGLPELKAIALAIGIIGTWALLRYGWFQRLSRGDA